MKTILYMGSKHYDVWYKLSYARHLSAEGRTYSVNLLGPCLLERRKVAGHVAKLKLRKAYEPGGTK